MPAKKLRGMEMTSAQGQLMTRKVRALMIQVLQRGARPMMSRIMGGIRARASARQQTMGK